MFDTRAERIAAVERELAEREAVDRAVEADLVHRGRRRFAGPSVVYSIRLEPSMVTALERRAAALALPPSVLARNLVRIGLRARGHDGLAEAVEQVDAAVQDLRAIVA